jgi:hypothetical protein
VSIVLYYHISPIRNILINVTRWPWEFWIWVGSINLHSGQSTCIRVFARVKGRLCPMKDCNKDWPRLHVYKYVSYHSTNLVQYTLQWFSIINILWQWTLYNFIPGDYGDGNQCLILMWLAYWRNRYTKGNMLDETLVRMLCWEQSRFIIFSSNRRKRQYTNQDIPWAMNNITINQWSSSLASAQMINTSTELICYIYIVEVIFTALCVCYYSYWREMVYMKLWIAY